MLNGAFALLERSLRIDARGRAVHLTRLAFMAAIYVALCFALLQQDRLGAPGMRFFRSIAYLDAIFMSLLGLSFFSMSITEEKEEDTLGLMLMAGISPLGILLGKSGGVLTQALLLFSVQIPFLLLSITMGGVTSLQVWAVTVALFAHLILLSGFGLLCSTLCSNSRAAAKWMCVGLITCFLVSLAARTASFRMARGIVAGVVHGPTWEMFRDLLEGLGQVSALLRIEDILATGFGQSLIGTQVVSNVLLGILFAGLAWALFGVAAKKPTTESTSRGLLAHKRAFFRFDAGRPQIDPFVWKDFHFVAGGIGALLVRVAFYLGLLIAIGAIHGMLNPVSQFEDMLIVCQVFLSFAVVVDAAMVLSRAMHDEVREQTLATLLMLPRSSTGIVYCKFAGALLGWLPGPVILLALTLVTEPGRRGFRELLDNHHGGWCVILLFALIPHFAPLVALYVRWGAVPIAIGLTIAAYSGIGVLVQTFMGTMATMERLFMIIAALLLCVCIACHIAVLLRVQAIGER